MTKLLATLAGAFLVAQVIRTAPNQQRPPTQDEFAQKEAKASGVPWPVLSAEKQWAAADVLVPLLASTDVNIRAAAVRAVGRLEDPRTVPALLAAGAGDAFAVAQALHGFDPVNDPQLIERVSTSIGHPLIRYGTTEQVQRIERGAAGAADMYANDITKAGLYDGALATLERLARVNQRLARFDEPTLKVLTRSVAKSSANDDNLMLGPGPRKHAFTALVSLGAVDADSEKLALADEEWSIRRLAVAVLAGSGGGFDDGTRLAAIRSALTDPNGIVRYEALRAYLRRGVQVSGCQPILERLSDDDTHVGLAAMDALGDQCKSDEDITTRVLAEAVTPQSTNWHRPTHAFVALAKRAPEKASMSMEAFATHPNWWVRMYAARAAAAMQDVVHLDKLAYDTNDNVREAALAPLRKLKKFDADGAIAAALERSDVQLLRSAALLLKESPHGHDLFQPLLGALMRLTAEGKETSRDARLPLLDAIEVHANPTDYPSLQPLLKDFDPKVAQRAADLVAKLSGKPAAAAPAAVSRGWPAEFSKDRLSDRCVTVDLATSGSFVMNMDWQAAPMTVDRFLKLATKDRYYDGLTFHRVVPNFVIQGGSPGANEYSGHKEYMRDEISPSSSNTRGSVGLSTRGRNTADAQFYVNLIDNPRLDMDYTIFAQIRSTDMAVVDRIEEGAQIRSIMLGCTVR
jgi:cyclophilin family peptidyl-prolyl cis-trans isomerase/HEAT repeat protein